MGISERKQRQHRALRSTILRQSWHIVEKEGWEALSVRRIAEAIEYSTPVVYRHFENNEAILEVFSREGYVLLADMLRDARDTRTAPADQLMAMAAAYWDFAVRYPKHYQIMYGLGVPTCEMIKESAEIRAVSDTFKGVIRTAIASGPHPNTDACLKVTTFWSILHGLVAMSMISRPDWLERSRRTLDDATAGFVKALTT